ncbi:cobalt-dependent inorganic pyrophosphatase [Rubritalea halochordaticola]|uniref:inorganic diphosphatase n=2 Tax=Rubritalea halochordaticola TaxID=714537 RepID=A0ABP9V2S4_9BACT
MTAKCDELSASLSNIMTLKSQKPTYVVGHLNPDTDAICAAIGQAEYLRASEGVDAMAIRCGDIPSRVAWVLEQAGIEAPPLVSDVRTTAELICEKDYVAVREGDTFLSVYRAMQNSEVKSVPVVSDDNEIRGILQFTDLMQLLMPPSIDTGYNVKTVHASPQKILETLDGELAGADLPDQDVEEELIMFVGASSERTVGDSLARVKNDGLSNKQIVICGDRPKMQETAVDHGVRLLVVTGGSQVDAEVCKAAREKGVIVILSKYDTATTVQLVRCSRVVKNALGDEFLCVEATEAVSDIRKRLSAARQDLFPVVKIKARSGARKLVGVFRKSALVDPPRTRLVLVDHNEYSQAVRGVEEAEVVEVIDHHRLGGNVVSREPIRFLNEPVGSSSTLVARKFRYLGVPLSKGVAMCLCAGLISDTLNLTSPTTTDLDRDMLAWLCDIAGVQAEKFTHDFFASGSLLLKGTVDELIGTDRKEFNESGKFISISQVEEMSLEKFDERCDEMVDSLKKLSENKGYDLALLAVTDITKHHSRIVAVGDPKIIDVLPFENSSDYVLEASGVVSRKKQIFPAVCRAIQDAAATSIEVV